MFQRRIARQILLVELRTHKNEILIYQGIMLIHKKWFCFWSLKIFKCDKLLIFPIFAILETCQSREISHALTT